MREEKSQEQPGTTEVFWSHEEMSPKREGAASEEKRQGCGDGRHWGFLPSGRCLVPLLLEHIHGARCSAKTLPRTLNTAPVRGQLVSAITQDEEGRSSVGPSSLRYAHTVAKPPPSSGSGSLVTPTFEDNCHHHACQAPFPISGSEVVVVQVL